MMSKIFLTSDLHFNHNREFIWCARGFSSVEEMNETIVKNWNEAISPEDDVYVCGDLCLGGADAMGPNTQLIERLNGRLHVVLGNHDTPARIEMYRFCKNIVEICYATMIHYRGYHFFLSHYPCMTANLEKESLKQCTINLFGHTHQTKNFYNDIPFMYHVGMDSHNCTPVLLDDAIEEMKNKVQECKEQL
jgi:calcineurin-like phosphoesterase family protein